MSLHDYAARFATRALCLHLYSIWFAAITAVSLASTLQDANISLHNMQVKHSLNIRYSNLQ